MGQSNQMHRALKEENMLPAMPYCRCYTLWREREEGEERVSRVQANSEVVKSFENQSTQPKKLMNIYHDRQSAKMNSIAFVFDARHLRAE